MFIDPIGCAVFLLMIVCLVGFLLPFFVSRLRFLDRFFFWMEYRRQLHELRSIEKRRKDVRRRRSRTFLMNKKLKDALGKGVEEVKYGED